MAPRRVRRPPPRAGFGPDRAPGPVRRRTPTASTARPAAPASRTHCRTAVRRVVARPVRLQQVPLLGLGANELLETVREILGDACDVVAQAALTLRGHRRHHPRMVP